MPNNLTRHKILKTQRDLETGIRALTNSCKMMRQAYKIAGTPTLRQYEPGFKGLARIVVGQQVSAASAAAIWQRVNQTIESWDPDTILNLQPEDLRKAGLSQPKCRTMHAIARHMTTNQLDFDELITASDDEVRQALLAISGIGPWSADIYLMFCLGRRNAFAAGDLALMTATQHVFGLELRPDRDTMERIAERWSPWRSVAAQLLWAYHSVVVRNQRCENYPNVSKN